MIAEELILWNIQIENPKSLKQPMFNVHKMWHQVVHEEATLSWAQSLVEICGGHSTAAATDIARWPSLRLVWSPFGTTPTHGKLSSVWIIMKYQISWNTRLLGAKKFNSAKIIRQYILQRQKIKCTSVFRLNVLVYHNRHRVTLVEILPLISYNIKCIQVYNRFKMVVKHHCAWTRYTQNYQLLKSRVN